MPRVLVNATSGLGENLLAVPFLRELGRRWPGVEITVAVRFDAAAELLGRFELASAFLVLDSGRFGNPLSLARLIQGLRRQRFDACFNLVPANKAIKNIFAWLSGARTIASHAYAVGPVRHLAFLADRTAAIDPERHDVEQNLSLLELSGPGGPQPAGSAVPAAGALAPPRIVAGGTVEIRGPLTPPPGLEIAYPIAPTEHAAAELWLRERGLLERPLLALHPGSSVELGMDSKRWPVESFVSLALRLASARSLAPIVLGGPDELAEADVLAGRCGGIVAAGLPLGVTAALLARCRLVISNDSFPMHLAAAVGAPVVALFGPTDPIRTAPWSARSVVVRRLLACSPCWSVRSIGRPFRCTHSRPLACIRELPIEPVLEACLERLSASSTP